MKQANGFTLIEVLMVLALIGILAVFAIPSYTDYVTRGKLQDATSQLSNARVQLEQYYQDNRNYGSTGSSCGVAVPITPSKYFSFTCNWGPSGTSNQTYTVTATGVINHQTFTYTIDQSNNQTSTTPWGNGATCWITSKGSSC
jgi:type IV pilus assembly protein PilE